MLFLNKAHCDGKRRKKITRRKAGEIKSDKAKSVRKYTKKRSGCQNLIVICLKNSIQHNRCALGAVLGA